MKQLTALLILIPFFASADPGPATQYLINEPASLMDIGLLRMRLDLNDREATVLMRLIVERDQLDEDKEGVYGLSIQTDYDYSDDMIIVELSLFGKSEKAEQKCKSAVGMLASAVNRGLERWFAHRDFTRGEPPNAEDLQPRTSVVCEAETPDLEQVVVTRRLDQKTSSVRKH